MLFVGSVLVLSGLRNASIVDTLRAFLRAQPLPSGPSQVRRVPSTPTTGTGSAGGFDPTHRGTAAGQKVAATAMSYVGKVPYKWAGETPSGWDCSGFVTYVLTRHGIKLPSNHHTTAAGFYTWGGARTIPRSEAAPGDLVCWPTHIGIATGRNTMVNAARPGTITREEKIWGTPAPAIRRPKAYGSELST